MVQLNGKHKRNLHINSKKVILFVVVSVILIVLAATIYAYQIFFSHPLVKYAEAEKQTMEDIDSLTSHFYDNEEVINDRLQSTASESNMTITGNISVDQQASNEISALIDTLRSLLMTTQIEATRHLLPEEEVSFDLGLDIMGMNVFNSHLYQDEQLTAIQSDVLYDQPLGFEHEGLEDRLTVGSFPRLYQQQSEFFTGRDIQSSFFDQVTFFIDYFNNLNMETTEDVEIDGEKLARFDVEISEDEFQGLLLELVNHLEEEQLVNSFQAQQFYTTDESYFDELRSIIEKINLPEGITYQAYYTNDYVAYRELSGTWLIDGQTYDMSGLMDTRIDDQTYRLDSKFEVKSLEGEWTFDFSSNGEPKDDGYIINRKMGLGHGELLQLAVDMDSFYDEDKMKTDFELKHENDHTTSEMSGSLVQESTVSEDSAYRNYELTSQFNIPTLWSDHAAGYEVDLNVEQDLRFMENLEVPQINLEDVKRIDLLSEQQRLKFKSELEEHVESYFDQFLESILPF
ncbi:hypothetical protein [Alkalibacillus aidingensis]|uniref:hypothetical protein n=1 Tax=Alkalibacillus aidingensis TaxID=2747607 RepID=UPI0016601666|nr:hypothetical protein [Alkalibacillus aidingensis]